MYSYFFIKQMFKIKLSCQDGGTEIDDTKSRARFLLIAFSLVCIGISRRFGTKWGILFKMLVALKLCQISAIRKGCTRLVCNLSSKSSMHLSYRKFAIHFVSYIQLSPPRLNVGIQFLNILIQLSNYMFQLFENI